MVDGVNNAPLWGLSARMIKLSNVSWVRQRQGTCDFYYSVVYDFDVNFKTFDRILQDEGNKVLNGHWEGDTWTLDNIDGGAPDPDNPNHFIQFKDRNGENGTVILDGAGKPATSIDPEAAGGPGQIEVKKYLEYDFLLLGIPTSLTT
jgi:hypothetical protein